VLLSIAHMAERRVGIHTVSYSKGGKSNRVLFEIAAERMAGHRHARVSTIEQTPARHSCHYVVPLRVKAAQQRRRE
jgi:hypothetical protein